MRKIILASASPRRSELLQQAGIRFSVAVSETDEQIDETNPVRVVEQLALRKAEAVAALMEEEAVVIGADTVVCIGERILGKPRDRQEAAAMLQELQGRTHQVYTGVAVIVKTTEAQEVHVFSEQTAVTMYPMTDQEIAGYIDTGEPLDKAGAYGIQGRAAVYIKAIAGDYNNVVGLPLARLYQEIKAWLPE